MPKDSELSHYGVNGMKWGVRHDPGHEGEAAKTKKIAKLDKQFEKQANKLSLWVEVNNRAAAQTNQYDLGRINSKPQYKNQDFTHDSPLRQKYYKEHSDAFVKQLHAAANSLGTNASGTKKYTVDVKPNGAWSVNSSEIKHDTTSFEIPISYDANGYITQIGPMLTELVQGEAFVDNLMHYGVKGMHWGRRISNIERAPTTNRLETNAKGKISKVELSKSTLKSIKPSEDAARAAFLSSRAKTKSLDTLSNEELQALVTRMNLEKQYRNLKTPSTGKKFVSDLLVNAGKQQAQKIVNDRSTALVANMLKKRS